MGNIPIINPSTQATTGIPSPRASGESFGAGIGRALAGLGGQISGLATDIAQQQARTQGIEARKALSQARLDMTQAMIELEQTSPPGIDFAETYLQKFDDYKAKVSETIPFGKAREAFDIGMTELRTSLGTQAMASGATMAATATSNSAKAALATGINTLLVDPTQYEGVIKQGKDTIATLGLPANARAALETEFTNSAAAARFQAMFNAAKTPEAVSAIRRDLETGPWKEILDEGTFGSIMKLTVAAESSLATLADEQAKAAIDGVEQRIKDGATLDPSVMAMTNDAVRRSGNVGYQRRWLELSTEYDTRQKAKGLSTENLRTLTDEFGGTGFDPVRARHAISSIESAGDDTPYDAVGPVTKKGNRAYGKYQVMDFNIGPWTKQVLGRAYTVQEFVNDPAAQDAVFDHVFGGYVQKHGNVLDAASIWFTGQPVAKGRGRSDGYTSSGEYVDRFARAYGDPAPTEVDWIRGRATQGIIDERDTRIGQGDAMGVANDQGIVTLSNLTDEASFKQRSEQALVVAGMLDTPTTPFTPDEVEQFKVTMDTGTIEEKLSLLENIEAMGSVSAAAFKQIGEKEPLLGHIGGLALRDPGVAREVLRGHQRLQDNPDAKSRMGADNANSPAVFMSIVGNSMDYTPKAAHAARLAADALYAQRVGTSGLAGEFNQDVYEQSIRDVLGGGSDEGGGIADVNGEQIVLPPGVTDGEFEQMLSGLNDDDLIRFSVGQGAPQYADGTVATAAEIAGEGRFRTLAAGAYIVLMADDMPLAGTGPNGHYVFQIDREGVVDVITRATEAEAEFGRGRPRGR